MEKDLIRLIKESGISVEIDSIRHLFWKDEIDDIFILTRYMEISFYSGFILPEKVIQLHIFSKKYALTVDKQGVIFDKIECVDGLLYCMSNISNLPYFLSLGEKYRQRPHLKGKRIQKLEKLLGHKIIPYWIEPEVKGEVPEGIKKYQLARKHPAD